VRFGNVVHSVKVDVNPETSGFQRYVAGEHMETDNLHITSWGNIGNGYLGPAFHRKFVKGQVLYGSRRTYLRKVAVAEFDGICANTTLVLEPKDGSLLPELLPFIMQSESFTEFSIKNSKGSVNPYINWSDLARYEFPLPPLDEQRRIAEILWAADEVITKNLVTLQRIISLKDSVEEESFFRCRDSGQPTLLSEIAEVNPSSKSKCKDEELVSFITMADVSADGEIINQQSKMYGEVKKGYTVFQDGDILFAKITPCMENGKGALALNLINGIGFGSTEFHVLRPMDSRDTAFIYFLTMNKKFRQQARRFMRGTAGQLRVPKDFLDEYVLDCLPKVTLREEMGRKLIEVNSSYLEQKRSIEKAKIVKAELLQKLLGGQ
jgi:type I restriction enzyme S subunit